MPYCLRYPRYLCSDCEELASDKTGRLLQFIATTMMGGFRAAYADTGESYPSQTCYVRGVRCEWEEAKFGGIVIQAES